MALSNGSNPFSHATRSVYFYKHFTCDFVFFKPFNDDDVNSHRIVLHDEWYSKPHWLQCVLVMTKATVDDTVEPRACKKTCQMTFAAHGLIDFQPSKPLQILVINVFAKAMHIPQHVVAYAMEPSASVMTILSNTLYHSTTKTPEGLFRINCTLRNTSCCLQANKNYRPWQCETSKTKATDKLQTPVAAVPYDPKIDREWHNFGTHPDTQWRNRRAH